MTMAFERRCFTTFQASSRARSSSSLGSRSLTPTQIRGLNGTGIAVLGEKAAGDALQRRSRLIPLGHGSSDQKPEIGLGRHDLARRGAGCGGDDHFGEDLGDFARGGLVELAIEGHDAAEGTELVYRQGVGIGIGDALSTGHTAGIGVLDDGTAGLVQFGHQLEGRIGILKIVVAQRLALQLGRRGHTRPGLTSDVECRSLMRVLAIAQELRTLGRHA